MAMKRHSAFTIVELLVAVLIILLFLAGAAISIEKALANQRDATRVGNVLSIGKAIDQSIQITRGIYPKNTSTGSDKNRFCVSNLLDSSNTNRLDTSLLPNRQIPQDPSPVNIGASTCTNFLDGYTYHSEYRPVAITPDAACSAGRLAICQQVGYSLEVGLENDHSDNALSTADQLNISSSYSRPTSTERFQYILNGAYCGTQCYQ